MDNVNNRVGRADALPPLDVFGNRRGAGYQTRHIGDGRVVVLPGGASEARISEAVEDTKAALAEVAKPKKSAKVDDIEIVVTEEE